MNKQECDIMNALIAEPYINQRLLSELSGHSLGIVNKSLRHMVEDGYLEEDMTITIKAQEELACKAPKRAIILAAGYGMRMVPINTEIPKGLLEIRGEPLIERIIKQLNEVGIIEIYVVVGFMKECYEYLIDDFGVKLIINTEYSSKNNLHSIKLASQYIDNAYIIPCDIWAERNPFHRFELYSWYMVSDLFDNDSTVRVNRKRELVKVTHKYGGNSMVGIAYIASQDAVRIRLNIEQLCQDSRYDDSFWEEALYENDKMLLDARVVRASEIIEINTYEQLRELDSNSNQLKSSAINIIADAFGGKASDVKNITVLKKGMTNRSFLFQYEDGKVTFAVTALDMFAMYEIKFQ